METPRVLAYNLAQTISDEDLHHVSGGGYHMTAHPTFRFSGINSTDAVLDYSLDW